MVAIARGQENTSDRINFFITVNGVLTNVSEMGFRILDITGGLPGTQVFPATAGTFENVTTGAGNFNVGSYFAYDNGGGVGWTPGLAEPLGTHRVEWRWKTFASSAFQLGCEEFEVLSESAGSSVDTYCSLADIRAEGITVAMASDQKVLDTIAVCQEFIDRACKQWFIPKQLVLEVDGTDSDTLHFGVPIIVVDSLKLNNDPNVLDRTLYRVYNQRLYPDDRRNPRIKLIRSDDIRDIFVSPHPFDRLKFRKGRQNQEIIGSFGFLEADGTTPKLITRALCKLTISKLQNPLFTDPAAGPPAVPPAPPIIGPLIEEETDDHRQRYGQSGGTISPRRPGLTGITDDQEILDIIRLYRAPIGLATPAHWSTF